jgi:hypothetical protein
MRVLLFPNKLFNLMSGGLNMKTRNFIVCVSFFVSVAALTQTKYGVEFVGGMNYGGIATNNANSATSGITGGFGVSMILGRDLEIVGNTLFTYFPPPEIGGRPLLMTSHGFIPYPYPIYPEDRNAYSCEIVVGPRIHGHGSSFVHPFFAVQGGMQLLRSAITQEYYLFTTRTGSQFLNIHGTEDIHLYGVVNIGAGLQFMPIQSVLLNLQASYKILIGAEASRNTVIPVTLAVQLPV